MGLDIRSDVPVGILARLKKEQGALSKAPVFFVSVLSNFS